MLDNQCHDQRTACFNSQNRDLSKGQGYPAFEQPEAGLQ